MSGLDAAHPKKPVADGSTFKQEGGGNIINQGSRYTNFQGDKGTNRSILTGDGNKVDGTIKVGKGDNKPIGSAIDGTAKVVENSTKPIAENIAVQDSRNFNRQGNNSTNTNMLTGSKNDVSGTIEFA